MKKYISVILILATVCGLFALPVSASSTSAFDILSDGKYAKTYTLATSGSTIPYTTSDLKHRGTVTYGRSSSAFIDNRSDELYILDVGKNSSGTYWAKVKYPAGNKRVTGYIALSTITENNGSHVARVSSGKFYCALRKDWSTNSSYYVAKNDTVYLISVSGSRVQILYPTSGGIWRLAWANKSDYEKYCGSIQKKPEQNTVKSDLPKNGAFVRIRYAANGKYLDVPAEAATKNGTQLQIWDSAARNTNQYFQLIDTGNGWQIVSLHSRKVIEVRNSSHMDCAQVAQWEKHNLACARWSIIQNSDGTVSFKNRESGLYLNVCGGGNAANGTRMIQYHNDGTVAMRFYIETISLNGYTTVSSKLSGNNVTSKKDISISSWHPFSGLTATMLQQDDDWEALIENTPAIFDAANFMLSWASNSKEVTRIHITKGKGNKMTIQYGSSIEKDLSGKSISLSALLVQQYYDFSPTIIFSSSSKADECIRDWFGVTGSGKYAMQMKFGKVALGEYGYYLLIEDGIVYQKPIIHQDTSHMVYYSINGKTSAMFDGADILREVKLPMSNEEASVIIMQLVRNGYVK